MIAQFGKELSNFPSTANDEWPYLHSFHECLLSLTQVDCPNARFATRNKMNYFVCYLKQFDASFWIKYFLLVRDLLQVSINDVEIRLNDLVKDFARSNVISITSILAHQHDGCSWLKNRNTQHNFCFLRSDEKDCKSAQRYWTLQRSNYKFIVY